MTKIKITIDKTKCIGSATCVVIAPANFELGEDGKARAIIEVTDQNIDDVKKAAISCPTEAITLQEVD